MLLVGAYLYAPLTFSVCNFNQFISYEIYQHFLQLGRFYYNMFGPSVGTLNVYVMAGLILPTATWTKTGSQGRDWISAAINVPVTRQFNVSFLL